MINDELCDLLEEADHDIQVVIRIGNVDHEVEVLYDNDCIRLVPAKKITEVN